jgi:hypothetical protein
MATMTVCVSTAASTWRDVGTPFPTGGVPPPVSSSPRRTRVLLALGILFGLGTLVSLPALRPEQLGLAARVYTTAAEAAVAGEPFYGVAPAGLPGYRFVYPPVVMLAALPAGLVGSATLTFVVLTAVSLAAGLGIAWLAIRETERAGLDLARSDRWLIAGFCCLSSYAAPTLVNGQLNLLLGLGLATGLVATERERATPGGAILALPATVKLFPATVGCYLLRRRRFRAVAAAIAAGLGLALVGLIAFGPDASLTYLTSVLSGEVQSGAFAADPLDHGFLTVRRQLAALLPVPPAWLPAIAVAVVAPIVALSYRRVEGRLDRWFAVLATLVGTLLVLPLEGLYFPLLLFPLVPVLYHTPAGRTRRLLVAGTVLTLLGITPATLEALSASGLPLSTGVVAVAEPIFRVILPGTVGMWLWLGAAVHWQFADTTG